MPSDNRVTLRVESEPGHVRAVFNKFLGRPEVLRERRIVLVIGRGDPTYTEAHVTPLDARP